MVGLRRALALLILGFYVTQFAMTALLGPDELFAAFTGLALCYGLAFVGLGAEWFWARWFAMGVGNFGSLALLLLFQMGFEPTIAFFGFTHLAVSVLLIGEGMAAHYEHSERAKERWNLQDDSLALMRRAIKSAGSTIPFLILYGLAPRGALLATGALVLGVAGLIGLLRGKTWSIFAMAGAGTLALIDGLALLGPATVGYLFLATDGSPMIYGAFGIFAAGLLYVPVLFALPMLQWLRTDAPGTTASTR